MYYYVVSTYDDQLFYLLYYCRTTELGSFVRSFVVYYSYLYRPWNMEHTHTHTVFRCVFLGR